MNSGNLYINSVQLDTTTDENGMILVYPNSIDNSAARVQEVIDIPNVNGGIIVDEGRYKNVLHSYNIMIKGVSVDGASVLRARVADRLLSNGGYLRVSDSFRSSEYYMAYVPETLEFTPDGERKCYKTTVNFLRKPQRFLTLGETVVTITPDAYRRVTVQNAYMPTKPILRIIRTGTGNPNITITMTGGTVTVSGDVGTWFEVDLDSMTLIKQDSTGNGNITFTGKPILPSGTSKITFSDVTWFTEFRMIPRWWQL